MTNHKEALLQRLDRVAQLAQSGPAGRFFYHPARYLRFLLANKLKYACFHTPTLATAPLFFEGSMQVALPAGTDIFLAGGKTHSSEIRLARFLICSLNPGAAFWDIGAHFGYFSLLAAAIVGNEGYALALEPSPFNAELLLRNTSAKNQISIRKAAISDAAGEIVFYEFPPLYSEYNALDVTQFKDRPWYEKAKPQEYVVPAITLDGLAREGQRLPDLIKIDVEGAEDCVIAGGKTMLARHQPAVVMEYLADIRSADSHRRAAEMLLELGYASFAIADDGQLRPVKDIAAHLAAAGLDSDNIVFRK